MEQKITQKPIYEDNEYLILPSTTTESILVYFKQEDKFQNKYLVNVLEIFHPHVPADVPAHMVASSTHYNNLLYKFLKGETNGRSNYWI